MFSFLSVEFALLFMVFFLLYWTARQKPQLQNQLLLLFGYLLVYLMAGGLAVSVLAMVSVLIFTIGQQILYKTHKKFWLVTGIVLIVANLCFFKYYDFFRIAITQTLTALNLDSSGVVANLLFPLGVSYYSFQAISYLTTLYKDHDTYKRLTFLDSLTYFSYFATLTSGPISRLQETKGLNDISGNPCGMYAQFTTTTPRQLLLPKIAMTLILLALAKKWWLAGYLADTWVNPVFANPTGFHSLEVLVAIYGYTLQLFLDFSGYSDMMVAFGLLFGFRLPVNFNAPLLAHNIRDFWDKWHISLSTWIRDYIYIPLGGSRKGFVLTQINLIIAMVLSGIWHGSTLNFFFWGLFHALAIALLNTGDLICQKLTNNPKGRNFLANTGKLGKILGVVVTVHFVVFAFVFFRATTFEEARLVFDALLFNYHNVPWSNNPLYLLSLLLLAWVFYPFVRRLAWGKWIENSPSLLVYGLIFVGFLLVAIVAPSGIPNFIYANF